MASDGWPAAYARLAAAVPGAAAAARLTLCGMNACVDARVELHAAEALFAAGDPGAAALAALLVERVRRGIGGEVRLEWPEGPAWLATNLALDRSLGGTGPQAAWVLSALGAPALLALEDRSPEMLAALPPGILLYEGSEIVRSPHVTSRGRSRGNVYIFDFVAGQAVAGVLPPRSSRVIVRLSDPGLEHDEAFDNCSPALAGEAGAGLVAGFNAVPPDLLDAEIGRVRALCLAWRERGLDLVHLELAGYDSDDALHAVLGAMSGAVSSLGMSQSELERIAPPGSGLADAMLAIAARLGVRRLCVHADEWAATVTTGDPEAEREALMMGSLLAAARAEVGRPVARIAVPQAARFQEPPLGAEVPVPQGWRFVACAAPYLDRPASTLGLGDTFTAGCLLVLGQQRGARRLIA